ncbi:hypothetical protein P3342_002215 [Pyrenophora teres f. teres]|nr:hypothetical protein P3342_002215 [Pyrenophora teres f. teres]
MEADESQLYQFSTPQQSNSFKRARRSLQSTTPLSSLTESVTSSPRHSGQNQFAPQLFDHINALKHLDDQQILSLLSAARSNGGQSNRVSDGQALFAHAFPDGMRRSAADRSSMSTVGSRASSYLSVPSSRVPSMLSDPRSSIASTDSSFTHYSAASSRLSTASSRLSTLSPHRRPRPRTLPAPFATRPSSQNLTGSRTRKSSTSNGSHGDARTANKSSMRGSVSVSTTQSYTYV